MAYPNKPDPAADEIRRDDFDRKLYWRLKDSMTFGGLKRPAAVQAFAAIYSLPKAAVDDVLGRGDREGWDAPEKPRRGKGHTPIDRLRAWHAARPVPLVYDHSVVLDDAPLEPDEP